MKDKILVLISTYNGEKYIKELIESVLKQEDVNVDILIRDDGSTDGTVNIINEYSKKFNNIKFYIGENLGYAKSFWNLLEKSSEYDFYAFCDQDDIWLKRKLIEAIKKLKSDEDKRAKLYTSNVIAINNKKEILDENIFIGKKINVYESFQKSILPGCTFVFNSKAKELLIKYNGFMESHDWATYNIINVFGKIIYDENSYIYYRIHNENTIGIEKWTSKYKNKILRFFKKSKCVRSSFAKDFYETYKNEIPKEYIKDIYSLGHYKNSLKSKIYLLFKSKYKGIVFKFLILLNKV